MGTTTSEFNNTELSSFPEQLQVFGSKYCSQQIVLMTAIEEYSLSGDNFRILDADENVIYRMEGRLFSCRGKKQLYDNENNLVASVKHKVVSLKRQINIFDENDSRVAVVRTSKARILQATANLKCWLKGNDEDVNFHRAPDITITGNWVTDNLVFANSSGQVIAKIHRRKKNLRNVFGKQTYECTVAPNIDNSFIAILTVCIDEIYAEASA